MNTQGLRGEVRIEPWADSPQFLTTIKTFYIDGAPHIVERARVQKNMVVAKLAGTDDMDAANALRNKVVHIARADARLPENTVFLRDLVGLRVVDAAGNEIGTLADVIELPTQRVYVVKGGTEHLIPAVDEFIMSTDIDAGVMTVRLIEGM